MTRSRLLTIAAVCLVVAGMVAFFLMRRAPAADASADAAVTASITTAAARSDSLSDVVTAYGVVQADPTGVITIAAPKALVVTRILVRPGQSVAAGQALAEVVNAPASDLAYRQAVDAARFAQTELDRVQRLYDEHLAATDQLNAARKAVSDAQAGLASQVGQGAGQSRQTLTAPQAAIVTSLTAAPGDRMAQDAPLMVLAREGAVTVKLGLEPNAARYSSGQAVTLRPLAGGGSIPSRLGMVGRAADPVTRTLDAVVPLNGAALPIGTSVQGDVVTGVHTGVVVPRAAVVFDETGPHVFVIGAGKAKRVFVEVGRDYGDMIELRTGVAPGAVVAVQGAYELQDGMAVKVGAQ